MQIYDSHQNTKFAIYFIEKGCVDVYSSMDQEFENKMQTLTSGMCFCSYEFFCEDVLYDTKYKSKDFVQILKIEREPFLNLIKQYTNDYEYFCYMKDQLYLNKNYDFEGIYQCNSCKSN